MLSRNSLIHGLRRDQLIGVLTISEFPVVMVESHFIQSEVMGIKPVIFNIDELLVSISQFPLLSSIGSGPQLIQYSLKLSFHL